MKTIMQELVDIMNEDQVSFTEWFLVNYQMFIEKEKEQIIDAYYGKINGVFGYREEGEQYYNQTYNQNK